MDFPFSTMQSSWHCSNALVPCTHEALLVERKYTSLGNVRRVIKEIFADLEHVSRTIDLFFLFDDGYMYCMVTLHGSSGMYLTKDGESSRDAEKCIHKAGMQATGLQSELHTVYYGQFRRHLATRPPFSMMRQLLDVSHQTRKPQEARVRSRTILFSDTTIFVV